MLEKIIKYPLSYSNTVVITHFLVPQGETTKFYYHIPVAALDNLAVLGTAAEAGSPAVEGVLGKRPAAGHTVNFLQDNWRRGKKEKNLRHFLN